MKSTKFLLLALALVMIAGCSRPLYLPPAAHTPLLKEKKEYQGGIYAGTHGLDVQGAYALGNHIGFMGTGSFSIAGQKANSHAYGEAGLGLFTASALSRMSLFAGGGYGYTKGQSAWMVNGQEVSETASATYKRAFVQSTIAFHTALIDMGVNPRFSYMELDYLPNGTEPKPTDVNGMFFEPVGFIGLGLGDFKLKWQFGTSLPIGQELQFSHKPFMFSMGIYFRIRPQKLKLF